MQRNFPDFNQAVFGRIWVRSLEREREKRRTSFLQLDQFSLQQQLMNCHLDAFIFSNRQILLSRFSVSDVKDLTSHVMVIRWRPLTQARPGNKFDKPKLEIFAVFSV